MPSPSGHGISRQARYALGGTRIGNHSESEIWDAVVIEIDGEVRHPAVSDNHVRRGVDNSAFGGLSQPPAFPLRLQCCDCIGIELLMNYSGTLTVLRGPGRAVHESSSESVVHYLSARIGSQRRGQADCTARFVTANYPLRLASIHLANDRTNFFKKSRVLRLINFPSTSRDRLLRRCTLPAVAWSARSGRRETDARRDSRRMRRALRARG
jgi:hypothetical protein